MSMPRGRAFFATMAIAGAILVLASVLGLHFSAAPRSVEPELPAAYVGLENPRGPEAAEEGRLLYQKGCATCHGTNADGKGPSARGMNPAPADFRNGTVLSTHSDAWLYWRITEGKHGTGMPSWNGSLEPGQRWAVVTYLRSLRRE